MKHTIHIKHPVPLHRITEGQGIHTKYSQDSPKLPDNGNIGKTGISVSMQDNADFCKCKFEQNKDAK